MDRMSSIAAVRLAHLYLACIIATHCIDGEDERFCDDCPEYLPLRCACNSRDNFTCHGYGRICYKKEEACNGTIECVDGSDEWNCSSCPSWAPLPCFCKLTGTCASNDNFSTCYEENQKCDLGKSCSDVSDEANCTCPDSYFACSCFKENFPTCSAEKGCIANHRVNNGNLDCESGKDEPHVTAFTTNLCGACEVNIIRFSNETVCYQPQCDNKTCYKVPSLECSSPNCKNFEVVCTSSCADSKTNPDCNKAFQCFDQTLVLKSNFCNRKLDCDDGSDEVIDGPGFKCSAKFSTIPCILPLWNIYDDVAQCYDKSDLCFDEDGSFYCFKCLDNRLIISYKQLCDGIIDCYDLSDECLCEANLIQECTDLFYEATVASPYCNIEQTADREILTSINLKFLNKTGTNSTSFTLMSRPTTNTIVQCQTKWGQTYTTLCDKRPECLDFSDECDTCSNPSGFCNDTCHSYYRLRDRYCDGYVDEAWVYLKRTDCPKGFDEWDCPMRYRCRAGVKVSIDQREKCNGIRDCDDGSDEENCDNRYRCRTVIGSFLSIPIRAVLYGKRDCVDGSDEFVPGIFSSRFELIGNIHLRRWFWIVAIFTSFGKIYVIVFTSHHMMDEKLSKGHINATTSSFLTCPFLISLWEYICL
ncbi:unnamed protein product [Clavelina lepadiformis]|uniref:Uncharacterized protein n=1 Tax=Clavelina lepadiformis TaxID=159417 RepID=A0ABP0F275_CLALP